MTCEIELVAVGVYESEHVVEHANRERYCRARGEAVAVRIAAAREEASEPVFMSEKKKETKAQD
jgi:hypothetical protein